MIVSWMVWTVVVTGLVGTAALAAESALRDRRLPTRWAWLGSLAGSLALLAWAWLRPRAEAAPAPGGMEGWTVIDPAWVTGLGASAAARAPVLLVERADAMLGVVWTVSGVVALTALFGGLCVLAARARRWRRARVADESVLVSSDFGPACVGLGTPEIVLPEWALDLPPEELRLACLHEAEHRDAGDTRVLFAGALAAAAMPWNPVMWWQLRRLRAAVEVDCDARVLRRGASKRAYGALLLELGSARERHPLPVLSLARSESLLERRLKMIVRNVGETRPLRSILAAGLSCVLLVAACDTAPPTTVDEPEAQASFVAEETPSGGSYTMTPFTGTVTKRDLGELDAGLSRGEFRLLVDGEEHESVPEALEEASISRVEVRKGAEDEASTVHVFTRDGEAGGRISKMEPIIYIDDVRAEGGLEGLTPDQIERVEVIKGEAAEAVYGPEGANGVIRVTLKESAKGSVTRR